jgi:23S rRNA (uracil1939-C5)-methyltransferase
MDADRKRRVLRLADINELEVRIEKLVAGGDGLARFEGIPILVPRSAPGDLLRVRLAERHPDYARAEIVDILEPGTGRRPPPCPYFERCGGCDLQHLEDELQTRLKVEAAEETLRRLGRIELPAQRRVLRGDAWGYRLRTQLHVAPGAYVEGTPRLGYYARGSHDLVPVASCPILVPTLEQFMARLSTGDRGPLPRRLDLAAGDDGAISTAPVVEGLPHGEVEIRVGGSVLAFDARSFFQAHRGLVEELCEVAVGEETGTVAYDLYAGVGLFTLALARSYERVVAVEGQQLAARYAKRNLRRNRLANAEVVARAVESWIRELPRGADRVLVNPPRAGLARPVRARLLDARPRRLTYVSCHPATLARDLSWLADGYALRSLVFVDLFPQSGHLETVAQLLCHEGGAAGTPPG